MGGMRSTISHLIGTSSTLRSATRGRSSACLHCLTSALGILAWAKVGYEISQMSEEVIG